MRMVLLFAAFIFAGAVNDSMQRLSENLKCE